MKKLVLSVAASLHLIPQASPLQAKVADCNNIACLVGYSESKLEPCATNVKNLKNDAGGLSIGAYQMSSRYQNAQTMLDWMGVDMMGLDPKIHQEAYASRFKAICRLHPAYSLSQQTEYLLQHWPEWRRAKRRYEGLKGASKAVQALALSVVVSHGYEGSKSILDGLRGPVPRLTEPELAWDISIKRACAWKSRSGSKNMKGWLYRANREYRWVLRALGESPENLKVGCFNG